MLACKLQGNEKINTIMAESSSDFKPKEPSKEFSLQGFSGSLALRIFLMTLVFLILPLIFYLVIMYRIDTKIQKKEAAYALQLVAEEHEAYAKRLIQDQFRTLDILSLILKNQKETPDEINQMFSEVKNLQKVSQVFLVQRDALSSTCIASSNEASIGSEFNDVFYLPSLSQKDFAALLKQDHEMHDAILYFTKVLKRDPSGNALETLSISIEADAFLESLNQFKKDDKELEISLVQNESKTIVVSTNPKLVGQTLTKEKDEQLHEKIFPLDQTNLSLLVEGTKHSFTSFIKKAMFRSFLLLVFIVILGCLLTYLFTTIISSPLKRLAWVMQKAASHDLKARYSKSWIGFEINRLGEVFNQTLENLIENISKVEKVKIEEARLKQELMIAQSVQLAMIPKSLPKVPGIEVKAGLIPAKEVGGDYYDYMIRKDAPDEIAFVIADTAGSGIFGCLYSLAFRGNLKSLISSPQPLEIALERTNNLFYEDTQTWSVFVTCWVGYFHTKTKMLRYSSCGHPFVFLFRAGKLFKELRTEGMGLGIEADFKPTVAEIKLEVGDTLVLTTDGLIEAQNKLNEFYGKARFIELIEKNLTQPDYEIIETVIKTIQSFSDSEKGQQDDFTMVVIQITA